MEITKIVITGGPCAGKTTAQSWIQNAFSMKGYTVLFIPETCTELICGGVTYDACGCNLDYQLAQYQLQLAKEQVYEDVARGMHTDKVLIVCDRGTLDNKPYMSPEEYEQVLNILGMNEIDMRDSYDAVFHMVTAAIGAEKYYTLDNNRARTESAEEAARLDDGLISAWAGHPYLRIIDNSTDYENKLLRLIDEIAAFLGEQGPKRSRLKFLVEHPDIAQLESMPACKRVDIVQTYLCGTGDGTTDIRRRGLDGHYIYYKTEQRRAGGEIVENEKRLTEDEYTELLKLADPSLRPLEKQRYYLINENQYFDIDVYPFWDDRAVLEIELSHDGEEIHFPDCIKLIKNVTNDPEYTNYALAEMKRDK